ncbi:MAG: adenylate/guanylate cyclase domain-containing protein [Mesorhizobium sp.]|uniref:CHASE2 domain-containing protein n=1 Tax=Mesorhizobium sp. TaxID=1871066 RepID=UPI000FE849DA|nr:adenylate/guanylate cyclase domain-containing protein [Mesorhizobium sp.]RWB31679.1 MAG: adenylate/guanylate cyclase domain-containing protein [Mesorhizobium sp.]RWB80058.1 MAG: adenylate/guanylate cyclase domain-containing protein [Mesorhizobium sp.]RWC36927.1 MAG: adenylate/guanylate cyclase domain-containing protein [Mesorhizobium sp.]RWD22697.1 MAG: adenylate/guanylate cyclase domain-containing protein [Mesorhizobium sp.]
MSPVFEWRQAARRKISGLVVVLLLLACHLAFDGPLSRLRERTYDFYQFLAPREATSNPVVIVSIDDASLKTYGRWPWNRGLLADLVDGVAESGAAVIGLALVLPEADISPEGIAGDKRLATALAKNRTALAVSLGNEATVSEAEPKAGWSIVGQVPETLPGFTGLTGSLPDFSSAAAGLGAIRTLPDPDGVLRHVPLLWLRNTAQGVQLWPSFALELLRLYAGENGYVARMNAAGFDALRMAGTIVPLEPQGSIRLWETDTNTPRISAINILSGRGDPLLRNAIAIVDLSAVGLTQYLPTPTRPARPGVDIHADAIGQMLAGRYLAEPPQARTLERLWLVLSGIVFIGLSGVLAQRVVLGALALALLAVTPFGFGALEYSLQGKLYDPLQPALATILLAGFEGYVLYRRSEQRRSTLARQFSQYLSPSVVQRLANSDTEAILSGEKREITILLSDIRGFTTMSEQLGAQEIAKVVNHFLGLATDEILKRDGTIDKFMGDAVLAFWNAPLDQPDHRERALEAGLALIERVKRENAAFTARGHPSIQIGVAIETGVCSVGNFGSERRFDYTAIGSPVNRAARLESTTKKLSIPLVLGPGFAQGASMPVVQAGAFELQGFKGEVSIFTVPEIHPSSQSAKEVV